MNLPTFTYQLVGFTGFLASITICALAVRAYQQLRNRSLLLIAIGAGSGAVVQILHELYSGRSSWGLWYFDMSLRIAGTIVGLVGFWMLLRHYTDLAASGLRTAPHEDSSAPSQGSGVSGQPPSAS